MCLEIDAGVFEGRFGPEDVGLGLDNVVVGSVDEFGGLDLGVYDDIGHLDRVSSLHSSP